MGYDGAGRRAWTLTDSVYGASYSDYFVYDGSDILGDFNGQGNPLGFYLRDQGGLPVSTLQDANGVSEAVYYYQTDGLGSVVGLTYGAGQMLAEYGYDAFGNLLPMGSMGSGPSWQRIFYTGAFYNPDLGMYQLGPRLYDPSMGRFTTVDSWSGTLQQPTTQDGYVYVENDPLGKVDPTGHFAEDLPVIINPVSIVTFGTGVYVFTQIQHQAQAGMNWLYYLFSKGSKASRGRNEPRRSSNTSQNSEADQVAKKYKLSPTQQRMLHEQSQDFKGRDGKVPKALLDQLAKDIKENFPRK